jgi:hypothetical protein
MGPCLPAGKSDENGNTTHPDENGDTTHPDDDACSFTAADLENDQEMEYAVKRLEKGEEQADNEKIPATEKAGTSKGLLCAKETWKDNGKPDDNSLNYWVDVDTEDKFDKMRLSKQGRYKPDLSERGVQRFVTQWRSAENEGQRVLTDLDRSLMNRFVEDSFIKWNWNSNKQFVSKMKFLRKRCDSEMQKYKTKRKKNVTYDYRKPDRGMQEGTEVVPPQLGT